MFDDALVAAARRRAAAVPADPHPVEHFSKRHPGMTIEDGYRIGRAWVDLQKAG
jgi:2-oxo-hept-3-ene-1,7-dioate hydratase